MKFSYSDSIWLLVMHFICLYVKIIAIFNVTEFQRCWIASYHFVAFYQLFYQIYNIQHPLHAYDCGDCSFPSFLHSFQVKKNAFLFVQISSIFHLFRVLLRLISAEHDCVWPFSACTNELQQFRQREKPVYALLNAWHKMTKCLKIINLTHFDNITIAHRTPNIPI